MHPPRAHRRRSLPATRGRALRRRQRTRAAFTLIELLVAITIVAILSALVISGFKQDDGDRMSTSARTLQAYLEGARSTAIDKQRRIGVRLITSQNDRRVVDSLVYVGATDDIEGLADIQHSGGIWQVANSNGPLEWLRMNTGGRQLIRTGNRIELPKGSGNWYTINAFSQTGPTAGVIALAGHYTPSVWNASLMPARYQPLPDPDGDGIATGIPYRMQLSPTPLPNSDPIQLERGIVIDLDGSQLPAAWRPTPITNSAGYTAEMDIMFDARGNPTGDYVVAGLLHLYLTTPGDVELTRARFANHPANNGPPMSADLPPIVPAAFDPMNPGEQIVPKVDPRVVTLFTQTGNIATGQVDLTDALPMGSPPGDERADAPFSYIVRGMEASQ